MREAGCETVVDAKDLAVVGITEILSHLRKIYGLFDRLIAEADRRKPDLAIVIDSPAFNWRVARQMKKRGIPVVYYVAPQFWAWRQGSRKAASQVRQESAGDFSVRGEVLSRPRCERHIRRASARRPPGPSHRARRICRSTRARSRQALDHPHARQPEKEVRMNLPTILEAVARLGIGLRIPSPGSPHDRSQACWNERRPREISSWCPSLFLRSGILVVESSPAVPPQLKPAMMATPFVMVYRVSSLTYILGKPRIKVPYFAMVNLIAGKGVVPELVQDDFTPEKVVSKLEEILSDGPGRNSMLAGLATVKERLRDADSRAVGSAAERAADAILTLLPRKS